MSRFKIKVARIEMIEACEADPLVRVTFEIDRAPIRFQVPVLVRTKDYDDTEMVQVARDSLHRMFVDLAAQSRDWKLSNRELDQLSSLNLRPKTCLF